MSVIGRRHICRSARMQRVYLESLRNFAGVLPFDDKASPEVIRREFGLSKNAFKRAIGHLLKEGKIQIKDRRIYLVK